MLALQGCQGFRGAEAPAAAEPAGARTAQSYFGPADAYPDLQSVPPRPQLSYPVQQRRAIVDQLVGDRENARYTQQLIRYRTGQSELPPPPRPEPAPPADAVVALAAPVAAAEEPPVPDYDDRRFSDDSARTLAIEDAELDDGSLNDFMRDLVRDSAPERLPGELEELPPEALEGDLSVLRPEGAEDLVREELESVAPRPAEPDQRSGPFRRLFGWFGGLFEDEPAPAAAPAPAPGADIPPQGPAAEPDPAPVPAAKPTVTSALEAPGAGPVVPVAALAARAEAPAAPPEGPRPGGAVLAKPGDLLAVVEFAPGSYTPPEDARALLRRALGSVGDASIRIVGQGPETALALDRARALALELVRLGARPGRLLVSADPSGPGDRARLIAARPAS